jgi:predicted DNA-binding transcriptional regulator YafY
VVKGSTWYLIAGTDAGRRTFRVGRVTGVDPTGEPAVRPADFDLAEAWEEISASIEEMRTPHHIEAIADAEIVGALRWMFDRQLTILTPESEQADGGRVRVRIGGFSVERLAQQISGFGALVDVVAPAEARQALADIGHYLVSAYSAG